MYEHLRTLSAREKEVLRLLLTGHDAKSVAKSLDLSVHTVNERLRDARRKLGVSSSREAARLMAAVEEEGPNFLGDKKMGGTQVVANFFGDMKLGVVRPVALEQVQHKNKRRAWGFSIAWLAGGIVIMSLTVTALVLLFAMSSGDQVAGGGALAQSTPVPAAAAPQIPNLMPFADTDQDGKVTIEEYKAFSEQGWGVVAQNKDEVNFAALDQMSQIAFVGVMPNAKGIITRQMYIDAIPARFKMLDRNGDGALNSDELNGRSFQ